MRIKPAQKTKATVKTSDGLFGFSKDFSWEGSQVEPSCFFADNVPFRIFFCFSFFLSAEFFSPGEGDVSLLLFFLFLFYFFAFCATIFFSSFFFLNFESYSIQFLSSFISTMNYNLIWRIIPNLACLLLLLRIIKCCS